MAKGDFVATTDEGKAQQMVLTRDNIGGFLATLGILPTDPLVLQQAADATYFRALMDVQGTSQKFGVAWTDWKNYERDGGPVAVPTPALFVLPPGFPASAVPPGIITRYRFFANWLKALPNYTTAMGTALGIEASHAAPPAMNTLQPVFKLTSGGNQVFIHWNWGGNAQHLSQCEIRVDRNDGHGEIPLTFDTVPGYVDTMPFPAAPTKWTYRAIYHDANGQVGIWSLPTSIIVGG